MTPAAPDRHGSLFREYGDAYQQLFEGALAGGIERARGLSDADLRDLERYSGIVGLVAQHVLESRRLAAG